MAIDHIEQGTLKRLAVQRPQEPEGCGHVVVATCPFNLGKRPQPDLAVGEHALGCIGLWIGHTLAWGDGGAGHGYRHRTACGNRLHLGLHLLQCLGKPGDRGRLKEETQGKLKPRTSPQLGEQAHGQERVPAQGKEAVVQAHTLGPGELGKETSDKLLLLGQGGAVLTFSRDLGCGKCPGIELAVGGQGQGLKHHEGSRHHVVGQGSGEHSAQSRCLGDGGICI